MVGVKITPTGMMLIVVGVLLLVVAPIFFSAKRTVREKQEVLDRLEQRYHCVVSRAYDKPEDNHVRMTCVLNDMRLQQLGAATTKTTPVPSV